MGGRTGKSLDSFSSCLNWAGLGAQSVVWSLVIAAVIMIHPSGFLGKENELGKCFSFFFFFLAVSLLKQLQLCTRWS